MVALPRGSIRGKRGVYGRSHGGIVSFSVETNFSMTGGVPTTEQVPAYQAIEGFHKRCKSKTGLRRTMEKIGKYAVDRFEYYLMSGRERNPDGHPWNDLSRAGGHRSYAIRKMKAVGFIHPIGVLKGHMAESHDYKMLGSDSISVFNDDEKAKWHLNGLPDRKTFLPERDWMWLEKDDHDYILGQLMKYLSGPPDIWKAVKGGGPTEGYKMKHKLGSYYGSSINQGNYFGTSKSYL